LEKETLVESFAAASSEPLCRGFAIGRSIYGETARRWLAGEIGDEDLMSTVTERYEHMVSLWKNRNEQQTKEGAAR
jgi:5-dehydro-2-deoxygluconokinase